MSRALNRNGELTLMLRAGSRDPTRRNLARLRNEQPQGLGVLVAEYQFLVAISCAIFTPKGTLTL